MDFIAFALIIGSKGSNSVPCANCGWSTMLMGLTVTASIAALVAAATASLAPLIALVAVTIVWLDLVRKNGLPGISTRFHTVKEETTSDEEMPRSYHRQQLGSRGMDSIVPLLIMLILILIDNYPTTLQQTAKWLFTGHKYS